MRRNSMLFHTIFLSFLTLPGHLPGLTRDQMVVRESLSEQWTLNPAALLEIDNIFGSIEIITHAGPRVVLEAEKTIYAKDGARLEAAREEVRLEITVEADHLRLCVVTPFREACGVQHKREWSDPGYQVHYDLKCRVPAETALSLKTITDGDIRVSGVRGEFDISHVNGPIHMEAIAGYGRAETVNGSVSVQFSANPEEDSRFKTLNGDVRLYFQAGLQGEFELKTSYGKMFSEFDYEALAMAPQRQREGNLIRFDAGRTRLRIAGGGPTIAMETFNGDLVIHRDQERR